MALLTLSQTARALTVTVDGEILPGESFAEDGVTMTYNHLNVHIVEKGESA